MRRFLFRLAAALSVLGCAFVAILWARSYSILDEIDVCASGMRLIVTSNRGRIHVEYYTVHLLIFDYSELTGVTVRSSAPPAPGYPRFAKWRKQAPMLGALGGILEDGPSFGIFRPHGPSLRLFGRLTQVPRGHAWLPHWSVVCLLGALPAIRLWVLLRRYWATRRSVAEGLCPCCGYDLRATPSRCPECGWAIINGKLPDDAITTTVGSPRI